MTTLRLSSGLLLRVATDAAFSATPGEIATAEVRCFTPAKRAVLRGVIHDLASIVQGDVAEAEIAAMDAGIAPDAEGGLPMPDLAFRRAVLLDRLQRAANEYDAAQQASVETAQALALTREAEGADIAHAWAEQEAA